MSALRGELRCAGVVLAGREAHQRSFRRAPLGIVAPHIYDKDEVVRAVIQEIRKPTGR